MRCRRNVSFIKKFINSSFLTHFKLLLKIEASLDLLIFKQFVSDFHQFYFNLFSLKAEQRVEASYKVWTDKYTDHVKLKKRLHIQRRENESLIDQIDSPKVKNDKEQQKVLFDKKNLMTINSYG